MHDRRSGLLALLKSLTGFTGLQLLGFVAPFMALPVIARLAGPELWVDFASAQAIGSLAGIVILFGWWTAGPAEYHRLGSVVQRANLYVASIRERLIVAAFAIPLTVAIVAAISPRESLLLCVLAALGMATYGLTPDWFFIASNSPSKLALYETIPRSISTLLSIPVMLTLGSILWFPIFQISAVFLAYMAMWRREIARHQNSSPKLRDSLTHLNQHAPIAASNILGGLYNQLMLPMATLVAPGASLATYVSADKLYKASRFSIVALANTLQSWVLSSETRKRHLVAFSAHAVLGTIGGAALALLAPPLSELFFGSELETSHTIAAALGVSFFCASVTTPVVRNLLIPHGHRRAPLIATFCATIAGLGSLYPLYAALGVVGVAFAVALSEATSLLINATTGFFVLRSLPKQKP